MFWFLTLRHVHAGGILFESSFDNWSIGQYDTT